MAAQELTYEWDGGQGVSGRAGAGGLPLLDPFYMDLSACVVRQPAGRVRPTLVVIYCQDVRLVP